MNRDVMIGTEADDRREGIDSGDIQSDAAVAGSDAEAPEDGDKHDSGQEPLLGEHNSDAKKIPESQEKDNETLGFGAKYVDLDSLGAESARRSANTGPFGILPAREGDPFHFSYYFKPGTSPSDKQVALALRIGSLMEQISRFKEDPTATSLAEQLRGIFQAGLVQASTPDPDVFDRHVSALETDFLNRVVTPAHRLRISKPTFNTAYAFFITSLLGLFLYHSRTLTGSSPTWVGYAELFSSLLFVVGGTLLGRLFFMVTTHQAVVTSINQFDTDGARIGSGGFVIFLDAIVGVIAFLVFFTGFMQIAIGANEVGGNTQQVTSALSTLDIKSRPSAAYLFGVIVGIARSQFIARVSSLARERLE